MLYKEVKVIMLPQNKQGFSKGDLCKCIKELIIYYDMHLGQLAIAEGSNPEATEYTQAQHLYFISDNQIKENDWCITKADLVFKAKADLDNIDYFKKIIATTDPSLKLPMISKEWIIDVFIPSDGKIDIVNLELIWPVDLNKYKIDFKLKITSTNEVIIVYIL